MQIHENSTLFSNVLNSEIDMKECSAYGQVTSPQAVAGQQHIYESTT